VQDKHLFASFSINSHNTIGLQELISSSDGRPFGGDNGHGSKSAWRAGASVPLSRGSWVDPHS